MFKKLNIVFNDAELESLKDTSKLKGNHSKLYGGFFEFCIADQLYLLDILSKKIKFEIAPDILNFSQIMYPGSRIHTDYWSTTFNIYMSNTNGDVTSYWNPKDNVNYYAPHGSNGQLYLQENLVAAEEFVANQYDIYLLDTSRIHSVAVSDKTIPRTIIRLAWRFDTFDTILNSITIP